MKKKQELHCHNCDSYLQFEIDMDLDGKHVIECPNCGHEHCRVLEDGETTLVKYNLKLRGNNVRI